MLENVLTAETIAAFLLGLVVVLVVLLVARRSHGAAPPEGNEGALSRLEDIHNTLSELERVFAVPQSRGAVGETLLSRLLEDWLPKSSFELQYSFRDGTRVDAVVKLGRYLVPVDAKFPFEAAKRAMEKDGVIQQSGGETRAADGASAGSGTEQGGRETAQAGAARGGAGARGAGGGRRASRGGSNEPPAELKKAFMRHADDIAERYIRPNDGTLGFALMYIPSERVYQYVFVEKAGDLLGEAMSRGVVPVSPSTLFLYLQTVAYGLRGFAVSKDARALLSRFSSARTESEELSRAVSVAGTHLKNLNKALGEVDERLERVRQRLDLSDVEEEA